MAVNYAALLLQTGRPAAALAVFDREIAEAPGYARAWSNRAVIRYQHGEPEAARSDAENALRLDPGNPQAHGVLQLLNDPTSVVRQTECHLFRVRAAHGVGGRLWPRVKRSENPGYF